MTENRMYQIKASRSAIVTHIYYVEAPSKDEAETMFQNMAKQGKEIELDYIGCEFDGSEVQVDEIRDIELEGRFVGESGYAEMGDY